MPPRGEQVAMLRLSRRAAMVNYAFTSGLCRMRCDDLTHVPSWRQLAWRLRFRAMAGLVLAAVSALSSISVGLTQSIIDENVRNEPVPKARILARSPARARPRTEES